MKKIQNCFLNFHGILFLFQKVFYEEYVNLNTLNFQNLKECRKMKECSAIEKTDYATKRVYFCGNKIICCLS